MVDEQYLRSKGIELSDEEWEEVVGMGGGPFIDLLRSRFGIEGTTADLIAEKDDLYLEYAAGRTRTFPTITELVRYLFVHGYRLAVGTASRRRVLDRVLEEAGLAPYFDATVGSDEVEHSKPAPDIFLEAARRLGAAPDRCLVIEDSQYGVEAAGRAGMRVVALPAAGTEGKERFTR
ncbi:MAG TPA: HAD family phosphatase, partial [Spirochaetia bacterium]|nr:HAD family phosphatase [Spirochaetia bacterium]